jgi:iduronate 2-sulfatase
VTELCGLRPPHGLEGRSLVPNLEDTAAPAKRAALSQFIRPWPVPRGARKPEIMGYSIRTESHRYTEWRQFDTGAVVERELYAYAGPGEFESTNLATDSAQAKRMTELAALFPPKR